MTAKKQKSITVNGMPDPIYIVIGLRPSMAVSELVRDVKNNSTNFINERHFVKGKFFWQEGFGAFSYSHSLVNGVYEYILKQEEHHVKKTFKEGYIDFLKRFEIQYDEKYLFDWIE